MLKKIAVYWDNFLYKGVIKNLLKTSKLGHGFVVEGAESGAHYEHIYDNMPQGKFFIGKFVDKALLNLPAVKATRGRKDAIKKIVWNEIENNRDIGKATKIVDLASGGARYLRELIREGAQNLEVFCIDKNNDCVHLGETLSKKEKLNSKTIRFFRGDIFKLQHINRFARLKDWHPNLVVASGLFIYFNDDIVEKILKEIHHYLDTEGLVIFQSYENLSSKKLMRKTMATSSGAQWTLYYRKPDFWRKILIRLGYKNPLILRDDWQMNNICIARK